jgi:hypothetical protein
MVEHVVTARAEENMFGKAKNRYNPQSHPGSSRSIERRSLQMIPLEEVAADPEAAAASVLQESRTTGTRCSSVRRGHDRFHRRATSESVGRNSGLSMQAALAALRALVNSPQPVL